MTGLRAAVESLRSLTERCPVCRRPELVVIHEDGTVERRCDHRTMRVRSRSQPGVAYTVLLGIDGSTTCTCRGYEEHGDCWHGQQVRERQHMTTEQSQALVPIKVEPPKSILPTREELSIIGTLAQTVVKARGHAVPATIDSPAKAAAVMLAGWELGVRPLTALRHIFVVNGRTEPDAQIMGGIAQSREPDLRFEVMNLTEERCSLRLHRPSRGLVAEYTYEIADAKRAGLVKSGNPWEKFPKDMLRWAAMKRLCRAYCADLINSVGLADLAGADALLYEADALPPSEALEYEDAIEEAGGEGALTNEGDEATTEQEATAADIEQALNEEGAQGTMEVNGD